MGEIRAEGAGGWVSFDGTSVTVGHTGVWNTLAGVRGTVTVPLEQLAEILYQPASYLKGRGFVRFVRADDPLGGALRDVANASYGPRDAKNAAMLDEWSMMFARGQQGDVQQVLDAIEQARTGVVVAVAADGRSRAAAPASSGGASTGVVDFAALAHEAPDEADGSEDVGSTPPSVDAGSTVAARLRDLAGLHADGIITDDEFEAKKAELLQQL